jgi:2-polyprenyl-3-methyl-5-hydroxy-6-metoxy-1,4-benzoquinol methylase
MIVEFIRNLLKTLRIDPHTFLFTIFFSNSQIILDGKLSRLPPDLKKMVLDEDERYHYGDSELDEPASQNVVRSFSIDRIRFIQDSLKDEKISTVLDIGDSNGLFLRSLKKDGISVNISDETTRYLKSKGLEVVKADIEHLPFRQGSIDLVLSFETLEHVKNPVLVLEEVERVCTNSCILSVPYVENTYINRAGNEYGERFFLHHIFEFNPADFKNIVKLTPLSLVRDERAVVLDGRASLLHRLVFFFWNRFVEKDTFCGCFKEFYLCHLVKKQEVT